MSEDEPTIYTGIQVDLDELAREARGLLADCERTRSAGKTYGDREMARLAGARAAALRDVIAEVERIRDLDVDELDEDDGGER